MKKIPLLSGIALCCIFNAVSCKDEDAQPDLCLEDVVEAQNSFTWNGSTYAIEGTTSDLIICSDNEVDAFYHANAYDQITFGFDKVSATAEVTVGSDGLPDPVVLLKDGQITYAAVEGTLVSCKSGYQFSLGFKRLEHTDDLTSTTGSVESLTGLIKCP